MNLTAPSRNALKRCLPLLLITAGLASAQDPGEEKKDPKGRLAWLLAVAMPEGLDNPVKIMTGDKVEELVLPRRTMSEPVKIPGDGIIRMVEEQPDPGDPTNSTYKTLAEAVVPEGVSKAMIILVPTGKTGPGPLFRTKVQDLNDFQGGETYYMNLSPRAVKVFLGKTEIGLKPGDIRISGKRSLAEPEVMPVRYDFYDPEKKQWKLISASTIVLYPKRREICIFSWDTRFNRIAYHGLTFPVED